MFGIGKKTSGCSTCKTASDANCMSDLTRTIPVIVKAFTDNGQSFSRDNSAHVRIVAAMLEQNMKVDDKHVAYKLPTEPKTQNWFFNAIVQHASATAALRL